MKKLFYALAPLILISCSQEEVKEFDLNYRNGLFYEVNSEKPFSGIAQGGFKTDGNLTKTIIKNGIPVSGEQYYGNGQLRIAFEVGETGSIGRYQRWQVKITECFHKNGAPCSENYEYMKKRYDRNMPIFLSESGSSFPRYTGGVLPEKIGSVSFKLEDNERFNDLYWRSSYRKGILEIVWRGDEVFSTDKPSIYCANGLENYGPCVDFGK